MRPVLEFATELHQLALPVIMEVYCNIQPLQTRREELAISWYDRVRRLPDDFPTTALLFARASLVTRNDFSIILLRGLRTLHSDDCILMSIDRSSGLWVTRTRRGHRPWISSDDNTVGSRVRRIPLSIQRFSWAGGHCAVQDRWVSAGL